MVCVLSHTRVYVLCAYVCMCIASVYVCCVCVHVLAVVGMGHGKDREERALRVSLMLQEVQFKSVLV